MKKGIKQKIFGKNEKVKPSKTHQISHESIILTSDSSPARRVDIDRGF